MNIDWFIAQRPLEIQQLIAFLEPLQPQNILEIGTATGGTTRVWAQLVAPHSGRVYTIDPCSSTGYPTWSLDGVTRVSSPSAYAGTEWEKYIEEIRGYSQDPAVLAAADQRRYDFLFIDGSHIYADVLADFDNYSQLVMPGGIIAFHDILPKLRPWGELVEVCRVWAEIKDRYEHYEFIDPAPDNLMGIGVLVLPG